MIFSRHGPPEGTMPLMRTIIVTVLLLCSIAAAGESKPRIAVFPLVGDAPEQTRDKAAFSLRAKLDRTGRFDVVDGPKMSEIVTETNATLSLASTPDQLRDLAKLVDADIVLWGEYKGGALSVKVLDLHAADPKPTLVTRPVKEPTDLRFAVEDILQQVQNVPQFEHPIEQSVWDDETSKKLWQTNPNLLTNGDFSQAGKWTGVYRSELYPVPITDQDPAIDKVAIVRNAGGPGNPAIILNLSRDCAESNGLAALSDPFMIQPNMRYRIQFRYKSDGPILRIFIKGYTHAPGAVGGMQDREVYRRQVPVQPATGGQWVTITDDFNPQHNTYPVQNLRVDLYAYLKPGTVAFDDVVVKAVGSQTVAMRDVAIKPLTTQPVRTKQ